MDTGSVPLIVIAVLILLGIYLKWDDQKNWETIYEAPGMQMAKAQARFAFLKQRGVKCRMKTITSVAVRGASPVMLTTVRVDVGKKDLPKTYALLKEFK